MLEENRIEFPLFPECVITLQILGKNNKKRSNYHEKII